MSESQFTLLGSGTSTGVPMPGCACPVCRSDDPRDRRMRSSALVRHAGRVVVIDTTPEFRLQMLAHDVRRLDAVLITHNHADHIAGLDDVRPYCFLQDATIPVYGPPQALDWIETRFDYIWHARQEGGGLPRIALQRVSGPFEAAGVPVTPVPVKHGVEDVYGYRVGDLAYIPDVSAIPPASLALLDGLQTLILDAVRYRPHSTHFHVEQSVAVAQQIGAAQTWLTHLNHDIRHAALAADLPDRIGVAFDGLTVPVGPVADGQG